MSRPMALASALAALAALAGCGTTVSLVPEPLNCPVAPDVLAQRCPEPQTLPDGANYGALVKAGVDDRAALRLCARHDQLLAEAIRDCNAAIDQYKARIREINAAATGKP
jgi:hypothetical protein